MVPNVIKFEREWTTLLARKKNGDPYGDERNTLCALENDPDLQGMLRYDAFRDVIEFGRAPPWNEGVPIGSPWTDAHRVELQIYLQRANIPVARASVVQDAVIVCANKRAYNPLRDYLSGLSWDQKPRLDNWLSTYLGAEGDPAYLRAVGRAFLIGAAVRGMRPGSKMDNVLVLESPQGRGKSTAVRILSKGWTTDYMPDLHSKDAAVQIQGTFLNEFSELAAVGRTDLESLKGFITRRVDRYRPPYGRNAIERPRACSFIGTTNLNEYLQDETGGRRFWPVRCRNIDCEALERDVDQLWAEAFWAGYIEHEPWHLARELEPLAEAEQHLRRLQSEHEIRLLEYLDGKAKPNAVVHMRELLIYVAELDLTKHAREAGGVAKQFSRILAVNGWEKCKPIGRGSDRRQPYRYRGSACADEPQKTQNTSNVLVSADENSDSGDEFDGIPF